MEAITGERKKTKKKKKKGRERESAKVERVGPEVVGGWEGIKETPQKESR